VPIRNRDAIAGAAGLLLLGLAFAWRWMGVPFDGAATPAPTAVVVPAPAPVEVPQAVPLDEAAPAPAVVVAAEPVVPDEEPAPGAGLTPEQVQQLDAALVTAQAAVAAGRLLTPPEDNALAWYARALELDPRDRAAREGRLQAVRQAIDIAHAQIDRGDLGEVDATLALLAQTGVAVDEVAALRERHAVQPQVDERLREGAQRMAAGQRFEPEGASALDSYRAALALDARNLVAQQGLAGIEEAILARALAAASEDDFEVADRLLGLATSVLPGTQGQLVTRGRVLELKRTRADGLIVAAGAALDARNSESADGLIARAAALVPEDARLVELRQRADNARTYANQQPGDVVTDAFIDREGSAPALVVIPIGEFDMGSPANERGRREHEGPQHRVRMQRPFAIGRSEVTQSDFARFIRASGYVTDAERIGTSSIYDEKSGRISNSQGVHWRNDFVGEAAKPNDPVIHVSFNDAVAFTAWISERTGKPYRLPSESEFEYALRAGTTTRFWWGNGNPLRVVGNYTGDGDLSRTKRSWTRAFPRYSDGFFGPAPVMSFAANGFGVHDMNGNVSEWVEDCWHDSFLRAPDDGTAWVNRGCARRVVRGGSWGSSSDQFRSAYRSSSPSEVRSARIGFRVARDL
jgi:formylglycine-generating enzyme required for sulfatase activity